MAGLKKKGPKNKKKKKLDRTRDLTKEDEKFKRMMEEASVYKRVNGAFRQVR